MCAYGHAQESKAMLADPSLNENTSIGLGIAINAAIGVISWIVGGMTAASRWEKRHADALATARMEIEREVRDTYVRQDVLETRLKGIDEKLEPIEGIQKSLTELRILLAGKGSGHA